MIEINGENVYIGDFHTHWYWDKENPTLFVAGMYNSGFDFALLCGEYYEAVNIDNFCKKYKVPFKVFPGKEIATEFAHIVCWNSKKFEKEVKNIEKRKNIWEFLKGKTELVIFAHPGTNWSASYNGTYTPLLNLYKKNLIDTIQVQHRKPYEIFEKNNIKISVCGGFDIHTCKPFLKYPKYVFSKNYPPFKHITPCSKFATVVFSKSAKEEDIIKVIKEGKACAFNVETFELIGDKELVEKLKKGNFVEKWKEEIENRNSLKIKGEIITGTKSQIEIKGEKVKYVILPDKSFEKTQIFKKNKISVKIPQILERNKFYIPLSIKKENTCSFYGLLAKSQIELEFFSKVKRNLVPSVELKLKNNSEKKENVNFNIKVGNKTGKKLIEIEGERGKSFIVKFPDISLNYEYPLEINLQTENIKRKYLSKIAFPVCKYVKDTPWKIDEKTAIILDKKENVYPVANWKGEKDLSGKINLYWDEKYFYLYGEIVDDVFYNKWSEWETFWGDSLQFAFGPYLKKIDAYGYNYELILAKTKKGNEIFIWNSLKDGIVQTRKLYKKGFLDIQRYEKRKLTIYKMRINWKFFYPFKPAENKRFLFSFAVLDNDGMIMKRKWFFYGENICVRKSMKNSHSVSLIK